MGICCTGQHMGKCCMSQNQLTNYVSSSCPYLLENVRNTWKFCVASPFTTSLEVILIISRMLPPHLLFVETETTIALWFSLGHSSPELIVIGKGRLHLYKKLSGALAVPIASAAFSIQGVTGFRSF